MTVQLDPLRYAPLSFDCKVTNLYIIDETTLGVELDRTSFFPQGGGQTGDRGTLFPAGAGEAGGPDGAAGIVVENVEIRSEGLLHLVKNCKETVQ